MRPTFPLLVTMVAAGIALSACARNLYKRWDSQLQVMADINKGQPARMDDVSFLLGTPPTKCDAPESGKRYIGILPDDKLRALIVVPGGPAANAGIRPGVILRSVDGVPVSTMPELLARMDAMLPGASVVVGTDRGTFTLIPNRPELKQCYWEVNAGPVARSGGGAAWGTNGGNAWGGGAAYQRYYRASCRFFDGVLTECNTQWQM